MASSELLANADMAFGRGGLAGEREKEEKRQLYFRIGLGALFLTVLALGLARRRKKT